MSFHIGVTLQMSFVTTPLHHSTTNTTFHRLFSRGTLQVYGSTLLLYGKPYYEKTTKVNGWSVFLHKYLPHVYPLINITYEMIYRLSVSRIIFNLLVKFLKWPITLLNPHHTFFTSFYTNSFAKKFYFFIYSILFFVLFAGLYNI